MKRVNIQIYARLGEGIAKASRVLGQEKALGGTLYFSVLDLTRSLLEFSEVDSGFVTAKRAARELKGHLEGWLTENVFEGKFLDYANANFEKEFDSWNYAPLQRKLESFKHVFEAESTDVEIYSVDQISIYKTAALVESGRDRIPEQVRSEVPDETLVEFDSAGRCLAFNLSTACGFHALRGLELMMVRYWEECGGSGPPPKSWGDCIKRLEEATKRGTSKTHVPSKKIISHLDRIRDLDRNPLMHPRDTLDPVGADQLFNLCALAVIEMARELVQFDIDSEITGDVEEAVVSH